MIVEYSNANSVQVTDTIKSKNGNSEVTAVREGFIKAVVAVLDSMWRSQTGNAVLRDIDSSAGEVFIRPWLPSPGDTTFNADEYGQGPVMSIVEFEPDLWSSKRNTINACEALLHELVHSLRRLSGVAKNDPIPTHDSYDTIEEYYSIVVGNVYRSELLRIGLRGGHRGESLPPKQRDDAAVFLNTGENRKRLETLKKENGPFFKAISQVTAKWNPFRLIT
jgi:hypothetical protein